MSKDIFQWMIGIIMAGFMGMLTIQGRLGNVRDSAGMRTVKYAIESIIPVIGGDVSDSLGSVLSTAALVRSTIGAAGLILILIATIVPFVRIAAVMLLLKFTSALCEPIGDDGLGTMLGQGAEVHEMLLVTGAVSCLLCILLIGSCMTTTGRILY